MTTGKHGVVPRKTIDYRLFLAALEKRLIEGRETDADRRLLAKPEIWRNMSPAQKLNWANLAQMAGDVDTALAVISAVNAEAPENKAAWKIRMELLQVLDRRRDLVAVLARAKPWVGEQTCNAFVAGLPDDSSREEKKKDMSTALEPFERLHLQRHRIDRYFTLFAGRKDCFARQWADRAEGKVGYVPVRRAMNLGDVEDHLHGRKTYGIYLLDANDAVHVAAVDADLKQAVRGPRISAKMRAQVRREQHYLLSQIKASSRDVGAEPLVEYSGGKGFHFWYFFNPPVPAAAARSFLKGIVDTVAADLSVFSLELFPKQDRRQGKGLGNLIKLPLGVHRGTGKTSFFMDCADRSRDAQLDFLAGVSHVPEKAMKKPGSPDGTKETLVVHPRFQARASEFPELVALEKKCPPLGQVMAMCRNGRAPCQREERVLYQTIGFLPRAGRLLHYLLKNASEYNPHLVDFRLSRVRGTPLGCKRIHSLLSFMSDFCEFSAVTAYPHPLLHVAGWKMEMAAAHAEKAVNLSGALENLKTAMEQVNRFLT